MMCQLLLISAERIAVHYKETKKFKKILIIKLDSFTISFIVAMEHSTCS